MTSFLPVLAFLSISFMLSACGGSTETLALQDPILVPVTPSAPVPPIDEPTNPDIDVSNIKALFDNTTVGESASRFVRATFITEAELGAREFRVWFWGRNTTGQFHFNPQKDEQKVNPNETGVVFVDKGTFNDEFEKISDEGIQHKYSLDIVNQWQTGGQFQSALTVGTNMEFEISQFLLNPPTGARLNYYGTSLVKRA
jgi:hypothetical protein